MPLQHISTRAKRGLPDTRQWAVAPAMQPVWALLALAITICCNGCIAHKPAKLYIPRHCITKIELTDQTECRRVGAEMRCSALKLTYGCTEVQHEPQAAAPKQDHVPVPEGQLQQP